MVRTQKEIIFHPAADKDLEIAIDWSLDYHGKAKTKKYYTAIKNDIRALASGTNEETPKIRGKYFSHFFPSVRSGRHLIYFLETDSKLIVIGVLHDAQSHPEGQKRGHRKGVMHILLYKRTFRSY
ncbi:MAG: type II toxin-antitoxin system RelE/ParE family toxin [Proteobacteria bacterium]|nr:type II toxin-antitoxin system RelE/ParE family toxin [Pseudomonadota bacterium]